MKTKKLLSMALAAVVAVECAFAPELLSVTAYGNTLGRSGSIGSSDTPDGITIGASNFPDDTFREYVLENFDTDHNKYLTQEERLRVTEIAISGTQNNYGNVKSLAGVEFFTNLQSLSCDFNKIASLNLSQNTALTLLDCSGNVLTVLDISNNTKLEELYCDNNQLAVLNVSNNTKLKNILCHDNQLTSLDVSKNTALTELWCKSNQLTALDLSNNNELVNLSADKTGLTITGIKGSAVEEYANDNEIPFYAVIPITQKFFPDEAFRTYVAKFDTVKDGKLSEEEIAAVTNIEIVTDNVSSLKGVEFFTELVYLHCYASEMNAGKLTSLDISKNTKLENLNCFGNQLTELDVSKNTALTDLHFHNNKIASINVSKNTALKELCCGQNPITELNVSKNAELTGLYSWETKLTSIDVSKNTKLTRLWCNGNQLTSLDISKNTKLTELYCDYNNLTTLDVSKNTKLTYLRCYDNELKTLVLGKTTAPETLETDKTGLTIYGVKDTSPETYAKNNNIPFVDMNAAPATVTAKAGDSKVTLTWDKVTGATKYRIERNESGEWEELSETGSTEYTDTAVTNGTGYAYKVYAYIYNAYGKASAVAKATPRNTKPENVRAKASDKQVTLTWNKVDDTIKYRVRRNDGSGWVTIANPTSNSYTDTTVTNGTTYSYIVYAYIDGAFGRASDVVTATPRNTKPENVKASSGDKQVTLTWNKVDDAIKYRVRRNDGTGWVTVANPTANSYTDTKLTNGKTYSYVVYAYVDGEFGTASDIIKAIPRNTKPANIKAVAGDSKITLTWDKVDGASSYRVRRNDGTGWVTVANMTVNTYIDNKAVNGKAYSYVVYAFVDGAFGTASDTVKATPVSTKPENMKAEAGDKRVALTWTAVKGATKYLIKRNDGTGWVNLKVVTTNSYTDTAVTNGKTYSYAVYAYVNNAYGTVSDIVKATPKASVIPQDVKATAENKKVTVTWNKVTGATKYRVRRNDGTGWVTLKDVTTNYYTDTAVTNGKTYYYAVYAYVNGAFGGASAVVQATPSASTKPANLKATAGDKKVTLAWDKVAGATKYRVRRNDGTGWVNYANITTNTYTDTAVTNGKTYSYAVYAYVGTAFGDVSDIVKATPAAPASTKPANVKATAGNGKVTLTWNAVSGATKYRVRRNDGTGWVTIANPTINSYVDTAVTKGKTYSYVVYAYVNGAFGDISDIAKVTP